MDYTTSQIENVLTVCVSTPNATYLNASDFSDLMDDKFSSDINNVILDLSCVKQIDSAFFGELVKYSRLVQKSGGNLSLVVCEGCGNHPIWMLIELTGTAEIFTVFNSVTKAINSCN